MELDTTTLLVAFVGSFNVLMSIYLARRNNAAVAEKDEAGAAEAISSAYATLLGKMETQIENQNRRIDKQNAKIEALESKCERYEALLSQYESINLPNDK